MVTVEQRIGRWRKGWGPRFQYRDFHYIDDMVSSPSYIYNEYPHTENDDLVFILKYVPRCFCGNQRFWIRFSDQITSLKMADGIPGNLMGLGKYTHYNDLIFGHNACNYAILLFDSLWVPWYTMSLNVSIVLKYGRGTHQLWLPATFAE